MNFFETLIHPDREELENAERVHVCRAANVLQVGEFQLLQLAYKEWFGEDLPEALVARLFSSYMLHNEVPHWARHYARLVLMREERGLIDENDTAYHRYDHDYHTTVPQGVRRFCYAVGILAFLMVSGILVAGTTVEAQKAKEERLRAAREQVQIADRDPSPTAAPPNRSFCYPPCIREAELVPEGRDFGWGRADTPNGAGHP